MSFIRHKYVNGNYGKKKIIKKDSSYYRINKKDIGSKIIKGTLVETNITLLNWEM